MNEALPFVVANFKANKNWQEVSDWLDKLIPIAATFTGTIVVCPAYPFLASSAQKLSAISSKIKLGAQDISQFEAGAYTGEVAASQINDLVSFSVIGHSERRQNFKENEETLTSKVLNAQSANIEPIFCVQDAQTLVPAGAKIVAYEPVFAIGTGNADSHENIQAVASSLKAKGEYMVLYGGSVSSENVKSIVQMSVDGVLVGATNSLDPDRFISILTALS